MLYFLMKEIGLSYNEALEFPVGLAYQLQHSHCRANDMVCWFTSGNEGIIDDLRSQFDAIPVLDDI